eukprot:scaffold68931_cov48-Prasinocladus_malaysianus.AAC.1
MKVDELDIIIANEGNRVDHMPNQCGKCTDREDYGKFINMMQHSLEGRKKTSPTLQPAELLTTLTDHGFNGTLLYLNNAAQGIIGQAIHGRWNAAVQSIKPNFQVRPFELMSHKGPCGDFTCVGMHYVEVGAPAARARFMWNEVERAMVQQQT